MSTKKFTEEEIAILAANPFTYSVTETQISYTRAFKEHFWSEYQKRKGPTQIFRESGYDPKILGYSRITGFQQTMRRDVESGLPFTEGPRSAGERQALLADNDTEPSMSEFRQMQHKVEYLEQEVEFLKKIFSTRNTRK